MSIYPYTENLNFAQDLVFKYLVQSSRDENNVIRLQKLMSTVPAPFGRSDDIGHITATGFVVDRKRQQSLLIHHRKLNCWLPPGGHCDGNPNVLQAALREVREETGAESLKAVLNDVFDIDIHLIPANKRESEHYHYDVRFLLEADCDEQLIVNKAETNDLRWIELEQLGTFTNMPSLFILKEKLDML